MPGDPLARGTVTDASSTLSQFIILFDGSDCLYKTLFIQNSGLDNSGRRRNDVCRYAS
jgi:hypothetical protein